MSMDPTPADLERAREWLEGARINRGPSANRVVYEPYAAASLAALLRSVREEGARQERERWERACEEERGLAERMLREGRPDHLAWGGRVACVGDILDTVSDESPTP